MTQKICPVCGKKFDLGYKTHDMEVDCSIEKALDYLCHVVECLAREVRKRR
jgi:hypothetical protein